jgi:hypothetical protein
MPSTQYNEYENDQVYKKTVCIRTKIYLLCFTLLLVLTRSFDFEPDTVVVLVLGCHIPEIQNDRINTAIEYFTNYPNLDLVWYLSGGKEKYQISEAIAMKEKLGTCNHKIHLDERPTNTAENFAYFKSYIETTKVENVFVVTSDFHHNRANIMLTKIFGDTDVHIEWILGNSPCPSCWRDEDLHIKNVENDVAVALEKYRSSTDPREILI